MISYLRLNNKFQSFLDTLVISLASWSFTECHPSKENKQSVPMLALLKILNDPEYLALSDYEQFISLKVFAQI